MKMLENSSSHSQVNNHFVVLISCAIPGSCLSLLSSQEASSDQVHWAEVFSQGNLHEV